MEAKASYRDNKGSKISDGVDVDSAADAGLVSRAVDFFVDDVSPGGRSSYPIDHLTISPIITT